MPRWYKTWMVGPGAIRRTLPYLKSGGLVLKDRVNVMEIHYNMYWEKRITPTIGGAINEALFKGDLKRYLPWVKSHTGLRELYFWDAPRLSYQNPHLQIVRFLDSEPLPFIRFWLNDGSDVLLDCDMKDRKGILEQIVSTLGDTSSNRWKKEREEQEVTHINPATFCLLSERACMCDCPGQVPCPGLVDLPMRMRGKYKTQKPEMLEEWENNPQMPYPSTEEIEKHKVAFPLTIKPFRDGYVEGLERVFMRKQKQTTRPYTEPEELVRRFMSDRFEKESDRRLMSKYPPPKVWKKKQ